jgi:hypothetical protein
VKPILLLGCYGCIFHGQGIRLGFVKTWEFRRG